MKDLNPTMLDNEEVVLVSSQKLIFKQLAEIQQKLRVPKEQKAGTQQRVLYKFRNVDDILEKVKPLLGDLIITLSDDICAVGNRIYVKATATISNGTDSISTIAYAREPENKQGLSDAQLTGACSSYARKYALGGLLLLDDNKDIDSLENSNETPKKREISELNSLKISLAKKFKEFGLSENDYTEFFEFVECDKNQIADLHKLLDMDLQGAIKEFYKFKGGEND